MKFTTKHMANQINEAMNGSRYYFAIGLIKETLPLWTGENFNFLESLAQKAVTHYSVPNNLNVTKEILTMYSKQNVLAERMNAGLYNVKVVIDDIYFAKGEKVAVITRPNPKHAKWIAKGVGQLDGITVDVTRKFEAEAKVHEWLDTYVETKKQSVGTVILEKKIETVIDAEFSTTDDTIAIPIEEDAVGHAIPTQKIKADRIDIIRGERNEKHLPDRYEIRRETTPNVWAAANEAIREIADTCNPQGSYLKTSFMIYWADGETYDSTRLDIKHPSATPDDNDLADHVLRHIRFYTGDYCPAHMTQEQYDSMIKGMVDDNERQECRDMLDAYQIGDTPDDEPAKPEDSDISESEAPIDMEIKASEVDEVEKQPTAEMDTEGFSEKDSSAVESLAEINPMGDAVQAKEVPNEMTADKREEIRKEFGIHTDVFSQLNDAQIQTLGDRPDDIPYDRVDFLRFQAFIQNKSPHNVFHYQGRFWYHGPAVDGDADELMRIGISQELQQDQMGVGVMMYPGTKGSRIKELIVIRALQSAFWHDEVDPNDEDAVSNWLDDEANWKEEEPPAIEEVPAVKEDDEPIDDDSPLRAGQIKTLVGDEIESFFNDTHASMSRSEVDAAIELTAHEIKFDGHKSLALDKPSFEEISTALDTLQADAVIFKVERQIPNKNGTQWEFQPHDWRFDLVDNKDENRRTKISLISAMICTDMQGDEIKTYATADMIDADMIDADLSESDTLETLFDQMRDDFIINTSRLGDKNARNSWTLITRDEYDALQDEVEEAEAELETPHEAKRTDGFTCIDSDECRDESGATWFTLSYRWEGVATGRTAFTCLGETFFRGTVMIIDEKTGEMYEQFTVKYSDYENADKGRQSIQAIYDEVFGVDDSPDEPDPDETPPDKPVEDQSTVDEDETTDEAEMTPQAKESEDLIPDDELPAGVRGVTTDDPQFEMVLGDIDVQPLEYVEDETPAEPSPVPLEPWIYDGVETKHDEEENEWHIVRYCAQESPHKKARYAVTIEPMDDALWHGTLLFQNGLQWKEEFISQHAGITDGLYSFHAKKIGAKWETYFGDSGESDLWKTIYDV